MVQLVLAVLIVQFVKSVSVARVKVLQIIHHAVTVISVMERKYVSLVPAQLVPTLARYSVMKIVINVSNVYGMLIAVVSVMFALSTGAVWQLLMVNHVIMVLFAMGLMFAMLVYVSPATQILVQDRCVMKVMMSVLNV